MSRVAVPAPFTCVVFQHCVSVGQRIVAGQDVANVEAMKLEMPVACTVAGTVVWMRAMGEQADEGEPVAVVEDGACG